MIRAAFVTGSVIFTVKQTAFDEQTFISRVPVAGFPPLTKSEKKKQPKEKKKCVERVKNFSVFFDLKLRISFFPFSLEVAAVLLGGLEQSRVFAGALVSSPASFSCEQAWSQRAHIAPTLSHGRGA